MVEWTMDGVTYPLVRPLTKSELKGIDDSERKVQESFQAVMTGQEYDPESVNKAPIFSLRMKHIAVVKCFGLSEQEGDKIPVGHVFDLFHKLVEYSRNVKQ